MYCTNCKHKYEGNFCPECGAKLVEEPQPGGVSVNLGDANAISGGINVETTNNVQNVDNRVTNIDNTVNNVSQTVNNIDNSVHNIDNSIHNTTQNVTHNVTNITQVAATEADVELAAEKATQAIAASETKRAEADILKEQRHQQEIDDERRKSKKRTMIVTIAILAIIAFACASFYVYIHTGKSLAEKASEATYNSINSKNINDIDIDTSDVPSDDESVVIDSNGDVLLCCSDWNRKEIVGNVMNTNIYSIWKNNFYKYVDFSQLRIYNKSIKRVATSAKGPACG